MENKFDKLITIADVKYIQIENFLAENRLRIEVTKCSRLNDNNVVETYWKAELVICGGGYIHEQPFYEANSAIEAVSGLCTLASFGMITITRSGVCKCEMIDLSGIELSTTNWQKHLQKIED